MPELEHEEIWRYPNWGVSLVFSDEYSWRLTSVDCESAGHTINGYLFIGLEQDALIKCARLAGIDDLVLDGDYEEFGKCYTSHDYSLMFWLVDNVVINFSVMLAFDADGDCPLWPQRPA